MQSVHSDISDLSDDSSVLTINDLATQPPTPRCSTPIFIDSTSSSDEASFLATFSPCPAHSICSSTVADYTSTHSQSHSITNSQTGLFCTDVGHGATVSEVSTTNTTVACSYSVSSQSSDTVQTPAFPPARPVNIKFPVTTFGSTSRTFNPIWYDRFNWLEYSTKHDACFCYPCHVFGFTSGSSTGKSTPEPVFTSTGFRDWKHATGNSRVLTKHSNCFSHKQAELAWGQYKMNSRRGTAIAE